MNKQEFPVEISIKNVKFLVPVEVEMSVSNALNGEIITESNKILGSLNLIHKEFITDCDLPQTLLDLIRKNLFEFLDKSSIVDNDQFELDDEIYEQASKAQNAHDDLHKNNVEV